MTSIEFADGVSSHYAGGRGGGDGDRVWSRIPLGRGALQRLTKHYPEKHLTTCTS